MTLPARIGRGLLANLDALLRRRLGVFEFTQEPGCILRLSWVRCPAPHRLHDGTELQRGDLLANIHLWNERMPRISAEGPDLQWARRGVLGFALSLRLLQAYLAHAATSRPVRAVFGEMGFAARQELDAAISVLARLGFDTAQVPPPQQVWGRFALFWENLYSYLLVWTYNPASLRGKRLRDLRRCRLWMSMATLQARYAGDARGPAQQQTR